MRLFAIALAATAASLLVVPSAFATEKFDVDAWLKVIFHGKPGDTLPALPAIAPLPPLTLDLKDLPKLPKLVLPELPKLAAK